MKHLFSLILLISLNASMYSNAWPNFGSSTVYNMFDQQRNYYNPALTGLNAKFSFSNMFTYQGEKRQNYLDKNWNNMINIAYAISLNQRSKLGLGFMNINQKLNFSNLDVSNYREQRLNLSYSYRLSSSKLSAGIYFNHLTMHNSFSSLIFDAVNPGTYLLNENGINAGLGIAYSVDKHNQYVAFSATNLLNHNFHSNYEANRLDARMREYYCMYGIDININKKIKLKPSAMAFVQEQFRTRGVLGIVNMEYKHKWLFGASYNSSLTNPALRLGYTKKRLVVNFNYELVQSKINTFSENIHLRGISSFNLTYSIPYASKSLAQPEF